MFKFLRKYNKWILAVGGTLLMIVFLIPQAIDQLSRRAAFSNAPQAKVGPDGVQITRNQLIVAQNETDLLDRLGVSIPVVGRIREPWHWFLLVREAEQAGLVGGRIAADEAQAFQSRSGYGRSDVSRAIARLDGVNRLFQMFQSASPYSDRRLKAAANQIFHRVQLQSVVLEASADAVTETFSEEEISRQMAQYAEIAPDDPDSRFGYRLPDRVKLEWLTVTADSVRTMLEGSDLLSGTELRKHWRRYSEDLVRGFPPVEPTAVPDIVREDLLNQLIDEKIESIARYAGNQLRSPTHGLPRRDGYLQLPEDWAARRLDLQSLAQAMADRFEVVLPTYESSGDRWLGPQALAELTGIGSASTEKFPPRVLSLPDLVAMAEVFGGSALVPMQGGVSGPPLRDADMNLYVFRILDTDASRPPESVDEVREQVVRDLKRLRHFEQLTASIEPLSTQARTEGLLALAMDHDTIIQRQTSLTMYDLQQMLISLQLGEAATPVPSPLPVIGRHEPTARAIIEHDMALPQDVDVRELQEEQRVLVLPVEDRLAIIAVRLTGRTPVTEETYRSQVGSFQVQAVLQTEEMAGGETLQDTFSLEALQERHNFETLAETPETPPEEAELTDQTASAE
jgi:hypothetical protein